MVALLAGCATVPALQPRAGTFSYAEQLRQVATQPAGPGGPSQIVASVQAMLGDVDGAIATFDAGLPMFKLPAPDLSQDRAEDAMTAILREAATRQIVILNEAHHVPMHRAFAMRLARELRKLGFEYLAAETFTRGRDPNAGIVDQATGAYTQDPVFAEFIREARRDGWKLVAYESGTPDPTASRAEQIRQREQAQARNLIEQVLARQPTARLFIHVGYGHAYETPQALGQGVTQLWMAGELKQMTGIDPLTIDQSLAFAHPDPAREVAGYRAALARHDGSDSFVLRKADGSPRLLRLSPGSVDLQVIHPPQALVNGRPAWLASWTQRRPFPIPAAWLPAQGRRLIYAVHKDHPAHAIPADIAIVEAGARPSVLMLPAGEFRFEFEDF